MFLVIDLRSIFGTKKDSKIEIDKNDIIIDSYIDYNKQLNL